MRHLRCISLPQFKWVSGSQQTKKYITPCLDLGDLTFQYLALKIHSNYFKLNQINLCLRMCVCVSDKPLPGK